MEKFEVSMGMIFFAFAAISFMSENNYSQALQAVGLMWLLNRTI